MPADLSRIRSDPLRDFAGVALQQGRVLLDADFNEWVAIVDRRLRAAASDILGRSTVSQTTPDAFKPTLVAGALQIGRGRLYVDGLLAENHGAASADAAKKRFDALLGEAAFSDAIDYTAQPYLPSPPPLPTAGRHLVYLDVWNRAVTALEAPELVEPALGVDTTARTQTVWQVRVLGADAANAGCASPDADLAGWAALTAPSAGRLTTGTFDVPPEDDPCELPPSGGYRGLENQTYRVEIHDAGAPGTATFKWSRENASIGARVASIVSGSELELQTLGRDDVLRFNSGDWVEIVDDVRELSGQAAGEMRRITVNEAARRITFTPALPAAMLPASFPDVTWPAQRNLRVRRWDQQHKVLRVGTGGATPVQQDLDAPGATGVITVPPAGTTVLLLESGVTVAFSTQGTGGFKAGDCWVFAARTADASVQPLADAPPRGIHHHFARLGIWDVAAGTVTDCRTPWPPAAAGDDCSCTACVTPASHASGAFTIQAAVDRVRDTGGTVCLAAGQYALRSPVALNGARSLRIRGQGSATLVVAPGSAFAISNGIALAVEDLAIVSAGQASAVVVRTALGLSLQRLVVAVLGNRDTPAAAIALTGAVLDATIRDNAILAPVGIRSTEPALTNSPRGRSPILLSALLRIEDNMLWCERAAVSLTGLALHLLATRITGNEIVGCRLGAITASGLCGPGGSFHIDANNASVNGPGISAGVDGLWIEGNQLTAQTQGAASRVLNGAGIALRTGLNPRGGAAAQILANQVSGFEDAGIVIAAPVRQLIVKLNVVQRCGNGIVSQDDARSDSVAIENNQLSDIGRAGQGAAATTVGIGVLRADAASVVGNQVRRVAQAASSAVLRAGIWAAGVRRFRASGNDVFDIAPAGAFEGSAGAGIVLLAPFVHADVGGNHVDRESQPLFEGAGEWVAVLVDGIGDERRLTRIGGYTALGVDAATALVFGFGGSGSGAGVTTQRAWIARENLQPVAGAAPLPAGAASVLGNVLGGRGRRPVVRVAVPGDCLFSDNRCELRGGSPNDNPTGGARPAVELRSGAAIVNANRVRGGLPSIALAGNGDGKLVTVLGNITTGGISGMPAEPWERLNVRG